MSRNENEVPTFRGEKVDILTLHRGDDSMPCGPNLAKMAERALGYLARNPVPENDYQCRFSFFLLHCPPFVPIYAPTESSIDPIAIGDTESRNDIAFNLMREMTGSELGRKAQEAVHRRLVGYLRSCKGSVGDDLCWVVPYCAFGDTEGTWAMIWTSAKLLQSEVDLFRLTGDENHKKLARRVFEGLRRVASWDTGRAFYPGGSRALREGEFDRGGGGLYPNVIEPLTHYWVSCLDAEALEFGQAMAEGFLSDLQPERQHPLEGHAQMHAIRGVAHLGAVTGNWRYLEWAKAAHSYFLDSGLDTGWLPENFGRAHNNHSETCLVADMLEIEVWLARSGWPRFWDQVDRTVRNYLVPAQFAMTPEIEAFWREVNHEKARREVEQSLAMLRDLEGGFLSALTPNDRVFEVPPGENHHGAVAFRGQRIVMDMMGCCPPEGMRAIYLAWANTVQVSAQGVLVNLAFDCDTPTAEVVSEMPRTGRVRVRPKVAAHFWLRPPGWAPRAEVKARRDDHAVEAKWGGPAHDYIVFPEAKPGAMLEITWPLVRFTQRVSEKPLGGQQGMTYEYHWIGSTVTAVEPRGKWLPLFG